MSYVNKSETLQKLQGLVQQNLQNKLDYMPEEFNEQQRYALELFQKRIYLERTIEETIAFNKKMVFNDINPNLKLTTTAEELVEVYKLRSEVYTDIGYQDEFPDIIEGLNFDKYDTTSAIVYYQREDKQVTGTCRMIFDSDNKLPSEDKYSFDQYRKKYKNIGEISRLITKKNSTGLNLEFKYLMAGMHYLFINNEIDMTLSGMKEEHFRLYNKFGGVDIVERLDTYGTFTIPCIIMSWDLSKPSKFFKKAFLN